MRKLKTKILSNLPALFFVALIFIILAIIFSQKANAPANHEIAIPAPEKASPIPEKTLPQAAYSVDPFAQEATIKAPFEMPAIQQPIFSDKICNITDYGAKDDGVTKNTQAFAAAIADCAKAGGGKVSVPEGTWLTGAIHLQSNINLYIAKNAAILFSTDPNDYLPVVFSRYEGVEYYGYSPFIYAKDAENIAITGPGKLIGQGDDWWPLNNGLATTNLYALADKNVPVEQRIFGSRDAFLRPTFIEFVNSNSILLENFYIEDGAMWTIHPVYSQNIIIRNVNIKTGGVNTDGIAVDSSKNVLIENSMLDTGDDAITIKSGRDRDGLRVNKPSENIIVRNCQAKGAHGGFSIGSETSGGIRNVFVYNCQFDWPKFGIRIKSSPGRGGVVENIWIQDVDINRATDTAIEFTMDYDAPFSLTNTISPVFRNIHLNDITARRSSHAISLVGLPQSPITDSFIKNVTIHGPRQMTSKDADGVKLTNVKMLK